MAERRTMHALEPAHQGTLLRERGVVTLPNVGWTAYDALDNHIRRLVFGGAALAAEAMG